MLKVLQPYLPISQQRYFKPETQNLEEFDIFGKGLSTLIGVVNTLSTLQNY